jgi:hypothetical protein
VDGRPKDITMNKLPACLFLGLFLGIKLVVVGNVLVEGAHHDHGNHAGEEKHNHEGVNDGEPVDLVVVHQQVCVPPGGPLYFTQLCQQQSKKMSEHDFIMKEITNFGNINAKENFITIKTIGRYSYDYDH